MWVCGLTIIHMWALSGFSKVGWLFIFPEMKMMVSKGFRNPTIYEMYMFCPANPELFVRGENLLAQHYEINEGFPIPKTTLMSGVNLFLDYLGIARDGCFSVLANK